MLKEGTIPIVDQPMIQAVKYALDQLGVNPDTLPKKKRRTCLDGVGDGGDSSYNGYFTIKLRTIEDGTQKIVVCDGATYDAEKGTSKESKARVNNAEFLIPYYETDVNSGYIVLQYTPAVFDEDGIETMAESIGIKIVQDTRNEKFIYEIGECLISDNTAKIIQRHGYTPSLYFSNGIAYIEYFIEC
jgi:hypothetical protein